MRRAVCPGSYDPLHKGHVEIIARAASMYDEVIVAVSTNYAKKYRFSLEEGSPWPAKRSPTSAA